MKGELKTAAEEYASKGTEYAYPQEFMEFVRDEIRDAFMAGAAWRGSLADETPRDAWRTCVLLDRGRLDITPPDEEYLKSIGLEPGDEVSVVILKEGD